MSHAEDMPRAKIRAGTTAMTMAMMPAGRAPTRRLVDVGHVFALILNEAALLPARRDLEVDPEVEEYERRCDGEQQDLNPDEAQEEGAVAQLDHPEPVHQPAGCFRQYGQQDEEEDEGNEELDNPWVRHINADPARPAAVHIATITPLRERHLILQSYGEFVSC